MIFTTVISKMRIIHLIISAIIERKKRNPDVFNVQNTKKSHTKKGTKTVWSNSQKCHGFPTSKRTFDSFICDCLSLHFHSNACCQSFIIRNFPGSQVFPHRIHSLYFLFFFCFYSLTEISERSHSLNFVLSLFPYRCCSHSFQSKLCTDIKTQTFSYERNEKCRRQFGRRRQRKIKQW